MLSVIFSIKSFMYNPRTGKKAWPKEVYERKKEEFLAPFVAADSGRDDRIREFAAHWKATGRKIDGEYSDARARYMNQFHPKRISNDDREMLEDEFDRIWNEENEIRPDRVNRDAYYAGKKYNTRFSERGLEPHSELHSLRRQLWYDRLKYPNRDWINARYENGVGYIWEQSDDEERDKFVAKKEAEELGMRDADREKLEEMYARKRADDPDAEDHWEINSVGTTVPVTNRMMWERRTGRDWYDDHPRHPPIIAPPVNLADQDLEAVREMEARNPDPFE